LVDLAYYWAHRTSHEVNLFWGGHVVHHQSEDYNLSVALRQSSFQVIWTFAFSLPLAIVGFDTWDFAMISAFNTLYQFWIHTEAINKLGWFEYIFNTPSHHRVHHGRNPKYIDKNHAGTLIIWDRMFGTFQPEEERPIYGITKPLHSWNSVWANVSHYHTMWSEFKQIALWSDKVRYLFRKPGWLPPSLGGTQAIPEIPSTYQKYDTPVPVKISYYVLFQYIVCVGVTAFFLFQKDHFSLLEKSIISLGICWWVMNCGVLFEQKRWVFSAEWLRILLFSAGGLMAAYLYDSSLVLVVVLVVYAIASGIWFKKIQ
jgi:alkylglycerol monooxygenase